MPAIKIKRGLKANLPTSGMSEGEPLVTTDRGTLRIAIGAATPSPLIQAKIRIGESWVNAVPKVRSGGRRVVTDLKI
ncbi:MAG: hypothetical protein IBX56_19790 [Methylomicrobium sp.]|nr:hypothetical protein [Methylomicrobium sp.]